MTARAYADVVRPVRRSILAAPFLPAMLFGCGTLVPPVPAPMFTSPLEINGKHVGPAIIDTGGGYEIILSDDFGLDVLGKVEVLAFSGREFVDVTEGFNFAVGGVTGSAEGALVGLSTCRCNGVGFIFMKKLGKVLALDFATMSVEFIDAVPTDATRLAFQSPPPSLPGFDSAFINVQVTVDGETIDLLGLLDTGTNSSVMRDGLFSTKPRFLPNRLDVRIAGDDLREIPVNVGLFDTDGLPDVILGTDVMRAWSKRWYFEFGEDGGTVAAIPHTEAQTPRALSDLFR
ncbi:MAG: hypothetical protein AABZ12_05045 [Planctomycetota bacterium]